MPERVSGPPPSMLPGAALSSFAARFCWQGQHFRLWTVPERVSGPPPSMLPGAALSSFAARFCWQGQHFRLWTVPERVSGPPPSMLPGAALSSFAARLALQALDGARARFGAPPLDAARRSTFELRGSFLLAGAALQALDGARARFGAPPLDAARRSTFELRGSFLLAGAALQALDGARARFGAPPPRCCQAQHFRASFEPRDSFLLAGALPGAALWSLAAHTHTHTYVDLLAHTHTHTYIDTNRIELTDTSRLTHTHTHTYGSFLLAGAALQALGGARARFGPPLDAARRSTFELAGAALQALDGARARFGAPPLDAARRSTFEPRGSFLLAGAALQALDGARARFGAPPLDAARRSTFELRGSFLLAGAALQALDGARARFGAPPLDDARRSTFELPRLVSAGRGSTSGSGRCPSAFRGPPPGAALSSLAARFCWQGQHFRLWTVPERVSGPPPSMLPGAGQHFRLWTVPERVSGPPPPWMLPGAALWSLAACFCWQGQHFRLWTVPERVSGPPPLDCQAQHFGASRLVSAGRGSTSGFGRCPSAFRGPPPRCCQAQHFGASRLVSAGKSSTSRAHFGALPHAALSSFAARFCWPPPRCCQAQHFGASRLVSARRGSTSGSGWCPSAFRGPPPGCCTLEPGGSFLLAGAALQGLDGARARFGAPPPGCCQAQHFGASRLVSAGRGCQAKHFGASLQALDGARARFGAPPLDAARRSTFELPARRMHFRLWTVPERVSGPPTLMLPGAALWSLAARSTSGSARARFGAPPPRCCQAQHFRASREPRGSFLLAGAALQALDGARARRCCQAQHFGASRLVSAGRGSTSGSGRCPSAFRGPLDAARRSTFEPRGSFLLAGEALDGARPPRCCQAQHFRASRLVSAGGALDGARARFGAPPFDAGSTSAPLLDSARRSTWEPRGSGSGVVAARTRTFSQFKLGARRPFLPPLPALAFERCCKPSGLLVSASA